MEIAKYTVIIVLPIVAIFISKRYCSYVEKTLGKGRSFLRFLHHLERKLTCYLSTPRELGDGFPDEELAAMVERMSSGVAICEAYSYERESLPEAVDQVLFSYFSDFGKGDLKIEVSRVKEAADELSEVLSSAEKEGEKSVKLCQGTLPLFALGVIILLI